MPRPRDGRCLTPGCGLHVAILDGQAIPLPTDD